MKEKTQENRIRKC